MQELSLEFEGVEQADLKRVIEPLASYVCAADQPQAALLSALALLFNEMDQTNRLARAHYGAFARLRSIK